MANKYLKRCSTSPIIREMQTKTTMKHHLISVKMVIINKTRNINCCCRCGNAYWYGHYGKQYGDSSKY